MGTRRPPLTQAACGSHTHTSASVRRVPRHAPPLGHTTPLPAQRGGPLDLSPPLHRHHPPSPSPGAAASTPPLFRDWAWPTHPGGPPIQGAARRPPPTTADCPDLVVSPAGWGGGGWPATQWGGPGETRRQHPPPSVVGVVCGAHPRTPPAAQGAAQAGSPLEMAQVSLPPTSHTPPPLPQVSPGGRSAWPSRWPLHGPPPPRG